MKRVLAIGVLAALTVPANATQAPPGYVPAIIVGQAPEGTHEMAGFAKKRDCSKRIDVLVERNGQLYGASGRIICR